MSSAIGYDTDGVLHSKYGIVIQNIWLLMLYASDLFQRINYASQQTQKEVAPDKLPDIIAEILVKFVRERLMCGLTRNSLPKQEDLPRVRGRIDILRTEGHCLLERGLVSCRFHEPTLNTPRNRLIKAALERGSFIASGRIAQICHDYASLMFRMGVIDGLPDRSTFSKEVNTINNREDRQAIAAARLLLEMAVPATRQGKEYLLIPEVNEEWLRGLFERAIRGFYRVTVAHIWKVKETHHVQSWPLQEFSDGLRDHLPRMELDILLTSMDNQRKIVIDTKFTSLLKPGWNRKGDAFDSGHLYQMYAYLRTQESESHADKQATGVLLYPVTDMSRKFSCSMHSHNFILATINLNASAQEIRQSLLDLIDE